MEEKQVIRAEVEANLVCTIIRFAAEEELTISNIKEAVERVYVYMEDNATLKKDYREK